jgi:phage virion morphogenesis protein
VQIHFNLDAGAAQRAIARLGERARNLAPAMREIGSGVVDDARLRFRDSKDPYGAPWQRLKASTLAARRKGSGPGQAKPLLDTGRLRNSVTYRVDGPDAVVVGTNVAYAAIHQFGGVIQRAPMSVKVRLRQIVVKRKDGTSYKATRFAKGSYKRATEKWGTNASGWQVKIPARPFVATKARGLPREYGEIIRDALNRHFSRSVQP